MLPEKPTLLFQKEKLFPNLDGKSDITILKGQLISKGLVCILNTSKKRTKNQPKVLDTSGRLVFVRFLEELKTQKSPFKIKP